MFFRRMDMNLLIDNELVAEAFASLPEQEQSILILHCVLELADGEIAALASWECPAAPSSATGQAP